MVNPLVLPGFESRSLSVQSNAWSGKRQLFVDGVPAPQRGKGEFLLHRDDGREVVVKIKPTFPDPAPVLEVEGQTVRTARPLSPFEWVWAAAPLALIILGGALGGALGAAAATVNINLIRDESKGVLRFVLSALVSIGAFLVWLVIGSLLQSAIHR